MVRPPALSVASWATASMPRAAVATTTSKAGSVPGSFSIGSGATAASVAASSTSPAPAAPAATDPADPGAAAFGNMAKTLTQEPAAAEPATPAAPTPDPAAKAQTLTPAQKAAQAATKARLQGTKAAGKSVAASTTGGFGKAVANAKAKGIATASKINYGNALSEALAARVEQHKRDIFETDLRMGKTSIFKK